MKACLHRRDSGDVPVSLLRSSLRRRYDSVWEYPGRLCSYLSGLPLLPLPPVSSCRWPQKDTAADFSRAKPSGQRLSVSILPPEFSSIIYYCVSFVSGRGQRDEEEGTIFNSFSVFDLRGIFPLYHKMHTI